jgi:hypothetical protein
MPLVTAAGAAERVDEPERARQKGALLPHRAGRSIQQRVTGAELAPDCGDRREKARVGGARVRAERERQERRVDLAAQIRRPSVGPAFLVPALGLDPGPHLLGRPAPRCVAAGNRSLLGEAGRAVERRPAHRLRLDEVVQLAADLPDARVGAPPSDRDEVGQLRQLSARVRAERAGLAAQPGRALEQVPVDVQLELTGGGVACADRTGSPVPGQVEHLLPRVGAAVDAVERLHLGHVGADRLQLPVEERSRVVREQLLHERAAQHRLAPRAVVSCAGRPIHPACGDELEPLFGVPAAGRRRRRVTYARSGAPTAATRRRRCWRSSGRAGRGSRATRRRCSGCP